MKTITEYQPLIYSQLVGSTEKRSSQRRVLRRNLLMAGYCLIGLFLSFDTGFLVWDWQFWVMFAPLLVAGEVAARALTKES